MNTDDLTISWSIPLYDDILAGMTWLRNWLDRHQHPASRALHAIGIPLTVAALVLALLQLRDDRWDLWWRPVLLLIGGYSLQWIGHVIERNDMGEIILLKKLMGKPYVAVSPRYENAQSKLTERQASS